MPRDDDEPITSRSSESARPTARVDALTEQVAAQSAALEAFRVEVAMLSLSIAASHSRIETKLALTCELLDAGFREAQQGIREASDDARAAAEMIERVELQRANDSAALSVFFEPTVAHAARVPELAMRLGGVESAVGEEPDLAAGKAGSGLRMRIDSLWRDFGQRKKHTGAAAIAGSATAVAVVQLLKLIAELVG